MLSLEKYADHSRSALECLRYITETLPDFVEISALAYTKGNAIRLSGTGDDWNTANDYFQKLGAVELFEGVEDPKISGDPPRFSIRINLPKLETEDSQ